MKPRVACVLLLGLLPLMVGTLGCGDKPAPVAKPGPVVDPQRVADPELVVDKPSEEESKPVVDEPEPITEEQAIAEIKKLGCRVVVDETGSAVEVRLYSTQTTAGFELLEQLTSLRRLWLVDSAQVTDAVLATPVWNI